MLTLLLIFGLVCVHAAPPAATTTKAAPSPLSVGYYTPFVDALNPATWIRNTAETYLKERLKHDFIRQQALYNIVLCLVKQDNANCNQLLAIADPLFRTTEPLLLQQPAEAKAA